MEQRLIGRAWRRVAGVTAVLGLAVFLSLAVLLFHGTRTTFDSWAFRVLPEHIPATRNQLLLGFTEPSVSVLLLALTVVLALSARRVDVAALAALGPALGTALASDVAKPLIHRTLFGGAQGSFPSGHETGVACTATVLVVACAQLPLRRWARGALLVVLVLWVATSAVALTRFYYHYATDTIGAIGFSIAFVLGLAALLDARPRRARQARPRAVPQPAARPSAHGPQVHGPQVHGPQVHGPQIHGPQVHGPQVHRPQVQGARPRPAPGHRPRPSREPVAQLTPRS